MPKRSEKEWFDRPDCARALGCTVQHFDRAFAPLAGPADKRGSRGNRVQFRLAAIIRADRDRAVEKALAAAAMETAPADSPALERYRLARARREELELAKAEKDLIARGSVHDVLTDIGGLFRDLGERLTRRHGNDVAEEVNLAVGQFEQSVRKRFDAGRSFPEARIDGI